MNNNTNRPNAVARNPSQNRDSTQAYYNTIEPIAHSIASYVSQPRFQNTIHQYQKSNQTWKNKLFGQKLQHKSDGICRIVSQNINCLGIHSNNMYKTSILKDWLYNCEYAYYLE